MISIIDYEMGNIGSIQNALNFLGQENRVVNSKEDILSSEKIILPGVGSFKQAMKNIFKLGLYEPIREAALEKRIPILGICLGMQLLADFGEEEGLSEGLGLIPGKVCKLSPENKTLKVPHVGFNSTYKNTSNVLFEGLHEMTDFYFVHSYHFLLEKDEYLSSTANYGNKITASIQRNNIYGVQFHPEKSQANGLKLLKNFVELG